MVPSIPTAKRSDRGGSMRFSNKSRPGSAQLRGSPGGGAGRAHSISQTRRRGVNEGGVSNPGASPRQLDLVRSMETDSMS